MNGDREGGEGGAGGERRLVGGERRLVGGEGGGGLLYPLVAEFSCVLTLTVVDGECGE